MAFAKGRGMTTDMSTTGGLTEPGFEEILADDSETRRIILRNGNGIELSALTLGCTIQSVIVPDRDGLLADVVLGFDTPAEYLVNEGYFGAVVGRYANRIAKGRFTLDGREYQLDVNNGVNHLHGGNDGFHAKEWHASPFRDGDNVGVHFVRSSPAGESRYPGKLDVRVTYLLTRSGELHCGYDASCDLPTIVNLTQHSYWNLAGHDSGDALDHELTIFASRYLPTDQTLIPLHEMRDVEGTPFDFRTPHTIGERIDDDDQQLRISHGYDHNLVLDRTVSTTDDLSLAARLGEPSSGRVMEVLTTEPGLQFYAGGMIARDVQGKNGARYRRHAGVALETQHFPDSPNRPEFPSVVLRPGEAYRSRTVYRFLVER
jgi:aldose 1-epimerase